MNINFTMELESSQCLLDVLVSRLLNGIQSHSVYRKINSHKYTSFNHQEQVYSFIISSILEYNRKGFTQAQV